MKIRPAQPSDLIQLEALFLSARRDTFYWADPQQFCLEDYQIQTHGETVFVAEDANGKIVGFISVCPDESPCFIHHLFVAREEQRKGIGTLLIEALFPTIPLPYQLKCLINNQNALEFYLLNGWNAIGHGVCSDGDYLLLELGQQ